MPKNAVCAEIGVWKGGFSKRILDTTQPKALHLIDPWMFQPEFPGRWYGGKVAKAQEDMDGIFEGVREMFKDNDVVHIHRDISAKALDSFPDNYFDWVYIDGNHHYEFVLEDLRLSLKKVKAGGFIAGDDYLWQPELDYPVKRAVQEFIAENGLSEDFQDLISQFIIRVGALH
ncbi:MAG: class I SAM-dependent methyltransferase [Pseudomonadota bacterium]